jgi:xanthine/uracil permease
MARHKGVNAVVTSPAQASSARTCDEKQSMKTVVLLATGWLCILVGAAGLVLPFVPGTVLLLIGVILLSQHYNWARRLLARARVRFPNVWRAIGN